MIALTLAALAGSWHNSFAQTPTLHPALMRLEDVSDEQLFTIYVECMDSDCDVVLDEISRRSDSMLDLMVAIVTEGAIAESAHARSTTASLRYATIESAAAMEPVLSHVVDATGPPSSARATFEALDADQYYYASITSAAHALAHIGDPAAIEALEAAQERALDDDRPDVAVKIGSRIDVLEEREAEDASGLQPQMAALLLIGFVALAVLLLVVAAPHSGGDNDETTVVEEVVPSPEGPVSEAVVDPQMQESPSDRDEPTIYEDEDEVHISGIKLPKKKPSQQSRD